MVSFSGVCIVRLGAYLSASLVRDVVVFLRLGAGMRHSMEKAVQLVHGMPREAASHRTCVTVMRWTHDVVGSTASDYLLCVHGML